MGRGRSIRIVVASLRAYFTFISAETAKILVSHLRTVNSLLKFFSFFLLNANYALRRPRDRCPIICKLCPKTAGQQKKFYIILLF